MKAYVPKSAPPEDWKRPDSIKDGAYFFLLRIRSAHLKILGFPMGGAY